jgi:outer membrane immunogenic protein
LFLSGTQPALAQRNIGSAIVIEREVSAALSGRIRRLSAGNGVFLNDNIRTANASAAQLQFLDQTRLRIGPAASVVLDRFVFNPDGTAREGTVEVTTGAVRWIGGASRPETEKVRTPHAVVAVQGTVFDVLVESRRTIVTLREGVIHVCPIRAPQNCVTLDVPGETVIVTTTTVEGPFPAGTSPTRFADLCLSPIDRSSCRFTTIAELGPEPLWGGFHVGVHGGYASTNWSVDSGGSDSVLDLIPDGIPGSFDFSDDGFIGGVQAGYSWVFGPGGLQNSWNEPGVPTAALRALNSSSNEPPSILFGLEADISVLSADAEEDITRGCVCPGPGQRDVRTHTEPDLDFLGTIRARAGLVFGNFLIFGTGGLAVGQVDLDATVDVDPDDLTFKRSRSVTEAGYVFGGGIEHAIADRFSIRAEYLHYDLGTQDIWLPDTTGGAPNDFVKLKYGLSGDIVRVGINYRFGGGQAADTLEIEPAADIADTEAPPAVYDWTGVYIGANIGFAFGGDDEVDIKEDPSGVFGKREAGDLTLSGLFGGPQVGFNFQSGDVVFGLEGDFEFSDIDDDDFGSAEAENDPGEHVLDADSSNDVDWFSTVRGRLGWAYDNVLLYATGGVAIGHFHYRVDGNFSETDPDIAVTHFFTIDDDFTQVGWTAGAGLEWAFAENWSAKVEYKYLDFGEKSLDATVFDAGGDPAGLTEETKAELNFHMVKFGVNYRF